MYLIKVPNLSAKVVDKWLKDCPETLYDWCLERELDILADHIKNYRDLTRGYIPLEEFLEEANGSRKVRLFSEKDYDYFLHDIASGFRASNKNLPFYAERDKGGVGRSYGYFTSTAQYGIQAICPGVMYYLIRSIRISSNHVPKTYAYGERAYLKWWKEKNGKTKESV